MAINLGPIALGPPAIGEQRCGNCRFWSGTFREEMYGHMTGGCHRHAPTRSTDVQTAGGVYRQCQWPITANADYCGDWDWDRAVEDE